MKTSPQFLAEQNRLLDEYTREVRAAEEEGLLAPSTARTYLLHAGNFVGWCADSFSLGARNQKG